MDSPAKHARGYEDTPESREREWAFWREILNAVVHFVRFEEYSQNYWNAVRIWGKPAFVHRHWDARAQREVAQYDIVVFAKGEAYQELCLYVHDDSNQSGDPAYWERIRDRAEISNKHGRS